MTLFAVVTKCSSTSRNFFSLFSLFFPTEHALPENNEYYMIDFIFRQLMCSRRQTICIRERVCCYYISISTQLCSSQAVAAWRWLAAVVAAEAATIFHAFSWKTCVPVAASFTDIRTYVHYICRDCCYNNNNHNDDDDDSKYHTN